MKRIHTTTARRLAGPRRRQAVHTRTHETGPDKMSCLAAHALPPGGFWAETLENQQE